MRVLIDTNIILDWLMCREPFHDDSRLVMKECMFGDLKGYISAHTLTDLFYILRKDFDVEKRKDLLLLLCERLRVIPENADMIMTVLNRPEWPDLEDGLQMQCAKEKELDYIVTRNIKDFVKSPVPAIAPERIREMLQKPE